MVHGFALRNQGEAAEWANRQDDGGFVLFVLRFDKWLYFKCTKLQGFSKSTLLRMEVGDQHQSEDGKDYYSSANID